MDTKGPAKKPRNFRQHPSARAFLLSVGLTEDRILQMSDEELRLFVGARANDEARGCLDHQALLQTVIAAARNVVAVDHGSNLPADRDRAVAVVAELEAALSQARLL